MKKNEIKIPGKSYPVYIGANVFDSLERTLSTNKVSRNLFLVIDKNFHTMHRGDISRFTSNYSGKVFTHEFEANEANKNFSSLNKIYEDLIAKGFNRDTTIVAIGGGITGDIAGFAAATYCRGIQYVQVPTTLLASVDSSVGGKTGINFDETKNIVGSFHQPEFVLIDTEFLKTLPYEEIICGIGEIFKYAFLTDPKFYSTIRGNLSKLLRLDSSLTSKVIETCINFKGDVVAKDEKESGLRKILNLGHTFAHAIEVGQNFKIKHGQSVVLGITCALELSRRTGFLDKNLFSEYLELPLLLKDKIVLNKFDANHMYEIMKRDKKGKDQAIKFVLINEIGSLLVDAEANESDILQSIHTGMNYFIK
jgi:3-dehydroquinate synthase